MFTISYAGAMAVAVLSGAAWEFYRHRELRLPADRPVGVANDFLMAPTIPFGRRARRASIALGAKGLEPPPASA